MIIREKAFPRAALIGNPSDGYFGKTIAFTFRNFSAEITLYESPEIEIIPSLRDHRTFRDIHSLTDDVKRYGYYGGVRLLKAAVKRFYDYCQPHGHCLADRNFTMRYLTTIPAHLGLAGSSAIITASFRALMKFYEIDIAKPILANLILSVETEELGIPAGLQDRVAQVYNCPVFMDFDRTLMERQGYGDYRQLDPAMLPPLYIAYRSELSQGSEILHSNLRYRYQCGEPDVLAAIQTWSELTVKTLAALESGQSDKLGELLDANFDTRRQLCELARENVAMVEAARRLGASAKFTGSGGAIIGTYKDEVMFQSLVAELGNLGISVIRPLIAAGHDKE